MFKKTNIAILYFLFVSIVISPLHSKNPRHRHQFKKSPPKIPIEELHYDDNYKKKYDLDSLCILSKEIVEGEIIKIEEFEGEDDYYYFKINDAIKGNLQEGEVIKIYGLASYFKFKKNPESSWMRINLEVKDQLILFLSKSDSYAIRNEPDREIIYSPIHFGVRWLKDRYVHYFERGAISKQYVSFSLGGPHSISQFRNRLERGILNEPLFKKLFQKNVISNKKEFLNAIKHRLDNAMKVSSHNSMENGVIIFHDCILEVLCKKFSDTQDINLISQAIKIFSKAKNPSGMNYLFDGLKTSEGRMHVLNFIRDTNNDSKERSVYISHIYHIFSDVLNNRIKGEREVLSSNNYYSQIIDIVIEYLNDPTLFLPILKQYTYLASMKKSEKSLDFNKTLNRLLEIHPLKIPNKAKWLIEKMLIRENMLSKLGIETPDFLAVVTYAEKTRHRRKPNFTFKYDYKGYLTKEENIIRYFVISPKDAYDTKQKSPLTLRDNYRHPSRSKEIKGSASVGGNHTMNIPPDYPKGKYIIYLEFEKDGKPINFRCISYEFDYK